ncbi:hypothetical protein BJY52DRAFT_112016 [Lactarius psammicola]|nr:hypothetical protein BJY52DRAFT_112016 [Lactarius psammicola]
MARGGGGFGESRTRPHSYLRYLRFEGGPFATTFNFWLVPHVLDLFFFICSHLKTQKNKKTKDQSKLLPSYAPSFPVGRGGKSSSRFGATELGVMDHVLRLQPGAHPPPDPAPRTPKSNPFVVCTRANIGIHSKDKRSLKPLSAGMRSTGNGSMGARPAGDPPTHGRSSVQLNWLYCRYILEYASVSLVTLSRVSFVVWLHMIGL